ncbi:Armadillo-like helical domain and Armadillo-type fold domain-containing protein [Strongyloides ratti]|uniref:Armadillo-like helical domain and Armadillo-type fold domain-containing protein n=1 Tax=Strongyloides ratti TaxID=34506 RepID=A0A090MYQ7_STRRB|nr:Armadillo-like helical domain and Armadillo-type fold domain-containing protein [Strongyloides ratti]CEF67604.1 Armadillo-like helical domain and Armadillo-type fold domain-containing protein [Strongyloides ratti]
MSINIRSSSTKISSQNYYTEGMLQQASQNIGGSSQQINIPPQVSNGFGVPVNNKGPINYIKNNPYNYSSPSCPAIQKLKNEYVNSPAMDSGYSCNSSISTTSSSVGNNYTAAWMQNYHSNMLPTFSGMGTPSVMSNMSHLSMADDCSVLSISTQMTAPFRMPLGGSQQYASSTTGYSENIDPDFYYQFNSSLDQLLINLRNTDDSIKKKAANSAFDWAKRKYFCFTKDPLKLQILIENALSLIAERSTNKDIVFSLLGAIVHLTENKITLPSIMRIFSLSGGKLIHLLCDRIDPDEHYAKFAAITLHTLFSQPDPEGSKARSYARSTIVIDRILKLIMKKMRYNKYLMIDCIRMLLRSNEELKKHFVRQGGLVEMLRCISEDNDERILYTASKTLDTLINSKTDFTGEFVKYQGIQILGNQLSHGSSRFLHQCVQCLSGVSGTDLLEGQDIREAIGKVIQILGSNDPTIALHGSGFLCNIAAKSIVYKEYLINCGGIENFICLMEMYCIAKPPPNYRNTYTEILDNSLAALNNLTVKHRDTKYLSIACHKIIQRPEAPRLLLNMIVMGNISMKSKALVIMHRIFNTDRNYLLYFVNLRDSFQNKTTPSLLYELLFQVVLQYSNVSSDNEEREKLKTLMKRTIRGLEQLNQQETFHMELSQLARCQTDFSCLEYLKDTDEHLPLKMLFENLLYITFI